MTTYKMILFVRAVPKPGDGHRHRADPKHENYRAFRREMSFIAAATWPLELLEGPLRVETDILMRGRCLADANNLHAGILDALERICYANDKQVVEGSYTLEQNAEEDKIVCRITTMSGKPAQPKKVKSPVG